MIATMHARSRLRTYQRARLFGVSKRKPLTETQAAALAAFANTQHAIDGVKTKRLTELEEMRRAALLECLAVGVANAWLVEQSGLSVARIGQLVKAVGGRPRLKQRMIPEQ